MYCLGHDDWFKYGWGPNLNRTYTSDDILYVKLFSDNYNFKFYPTIVAGLDAIKKITETYPAPYHLMCSGGADSQAMVWLWYLSGVPFTINMVKYITDGRWYNRDDIVNLYQFCETYDIPQPIEHEFDVIGFLESPNYGELLSKFACYSPQVCTHIKFSELIENGTLLYSGNCLEYQGELQNGVMILNKPGWVVKGLHRYASEINDTNDTKKIIPFFFLHTPELAFSIPSKLKDMVKSLEFDRPLTDGLDKKSLTPKEASLLHYIDKINLYRMSGLPIIPQAIKMTGFEKIKDYYELKKLNIPPKVKLQAAALPKNPMTNFDFYFRFAMSVNEPIKQPEKAIYQIPSSICDVLNTKR